MASMAAEPAPPLEIDPAQLGTLDLETYIVPYISLDDEPAIRARLQIAGTEYAYERSYPVKGHSAVMPEIVADAIADGRQVLVAERDNRYFLYLTS